MPKQSWKYHKIMTIFKRDRKTNEILEGQYSTPEIEYLADKQWEFTEKVDGTNIRIRYDGENVQIAGRSDEAQIPVELLQKLQLLFQSGEGIGKFEEHFTKDEYATDFEVVFYGEGYGPKIQKGGGNYGQEVNFVLFDVKIGNWYLKRDAVDSIAKQFGIKSVPIIGHGTLNDAIEIVKNGMKSQWGDFIAEGIVARPVIELFTRSGERIITKIKYKDYEKNNNNRKKTN